MGRRLPAFPLQRMTEKNVPCRASIAVQKLDGRQSGRLVEQQLGEFCALRRGEQFAFVQQLPDHPFLLLVLHQIGARSIR